jgi:hypothetical protein
MFVVCYVGSGFCCGLIPRLEDFSPSFVCVCVWRPWPDLGCSTSREGRLFVVKFLFLSPVFGFPMKHRLCTLQIFYIIFFAFGLPETFS